MAVVFNEDEEEVRQGTSLQTLGMVTKLYGPAPPQDQRGETIVAHDDRDAVEEEDMEEGEDADYDVVLHTDVSTFCFSLPTLSLSLSSSPYPLPSLSSWPPSQCLSPFVLLLHTPKALLPVLLQRDADSLTSGGRSRDKLQPRSVDAYWLQRELNKFFNDPIVSLSYVSLVRHLIHVHVQYCH